ncbi:ABC transporter ATP-binding protein [bacterium]|nr:ABC transporter ATP-binding protein [bacterium]
MILAAHKYCYTVQVGARRVVPLLQDISFSVQAGERFAIVGPNGAGKSTLLKSICRILPYGQGEIRVAGKRVQDYSQKELARKLSYVPQAVLRNHGFTVFEFVLMGRYPHFSPFTTITSNDLQKVNQALEMTGMLPFVQRRMDTLSGGEQQKVMIAAVLAQEAEIMLLDEPAAFLDPYHQEQVYTLLEKICQETQVTIVEVTHDVNRAALGHERILGLRDGEVVFCGTPQEFMRQEVLYSIYGKKFELAKHPRNGRDIILPEVALCQ